MVKMTLLNYFINFYLYGFYSKCFTCFLDKKVKKLNS